tara:strand:- start:3357 stop:4214 length:858 start_codon:yes stop_codon:yes gene_type:complete
MKGIILAGGHATRLRPLTTHYCKQLLPVFDKPMIYYPISTLIKMGVDDMLLIITSKDQLAYKELLSSGEEFGINIEYVIQDNPNGIAEALILGESFINGEKVALILGDNIFYGSDIDNLGEVESNIGARVFGYEVSDPDRYGVIKFENDVVKDIIEKPQKYISSFAVTGLYLYDGSASKRAKTLQPSKRGELEITDLNKTYLKDNMLHAHFIEKNNLWLDTGTFSSLMEASNIIYSIQSRLGSLICSPHEEAFKKGYIDIEKLEEISKKYNKSGYGKNLFNGIKK